MSEYFELDGETSLQLRDNSSIIDKFIMMFTAYQFNFFVAFLGFYIVRYVFPNTILGKDQSMKDGLTIAFFYAMFYFIMSELIEYKKTLDIS
jgi:hypothetical protein